MAAVKHTKNELKAQRDALRRFERYLPTLLMKKQQLQLEIRQVEARLAEVLGSERELDRRLDSFVALFQEPFPFGSWLRVAAVRRGTTNVAGVELPVLHEVVVARERPDLFATPPWVDDGCDALAEMLRLRVAKTFLAEQRRRLAAELLTTSQRVNLIEKVKIPAARAAIRSIRIFLGDVQTLDVARSKISKRKTLERETAQ